MLVDLDVWAGDIYAGSLPQVCVLTGEATRGVHSVRFSTTPRWVIALLFAGILPWLVAVFILRRQVTGTLPMCQRALRRFVVQRIATVVIVVVIPVLCIVLAIVFADRTSGWFALTAVAFVLVGGLACGTWSGAIGVAARVDDRPNWGRWVRLYGVNPTFAAAVQRMYAARFPAWQAGTVPPSFSGVPLPDGYAPAWTPPGPWQAWQANSAQPPARPPLV